MHCLSQLQRIQAERHSTDSGCATPTYIIHVFVAHTLP